VGGVNATRSKRVFVWLMVAVLAGITGTVSYLHALYVVRWAANTGPVAYLIPFVPDLMIVTSSVTLVEAKRVADRRPWQAMLALGTGVVVTVVMNVAAGLHYGAGSMLLNGLIPVAFILSLESLIVLLGIWRNAPLRAGEEATCGHFVPLNVNDAIVLAARTDPGLSIRALSDAFGVPRARVSQLVPRKPSLAETNGQGHDLALQPGTEESGS
jgi:hypothetical protein